MYQKILEIFKNIIVISKFTKTSKKKRSVFLLGLIGNLLVLSDILIILIFASFFDQNIDTNNIFISAAVGQTIDGSNQIALESPYASVQIYTDGVSKYYIF